MATVCEGLLDILSEVGVDEIYGITGDALNSLVNSIRKNDDFRWVSVKHEESAAFAAAAQAKYTGRLAVCAGTVGPGALHLLNGLYDAKRDRAPVLAITGQVPASEYGSGFFQEVDLERVFGDVAVFNQTVRSIDQFERLAHAAVQTAIEQRGVAHLSIPVDLIGQRLPKSNFRGQLVAEMPPIEPTQSSIDDAVKAIQGASKPTILAGDGARGAASDLLALAEKIQAPIVHSLKGSDVVPYDHPLWIGGIGHLGTPQGLAALDGCDLLLMAGSDFPYRAFLPNGINIIQIDEKRAHIGRRCAVTHPIVGSVAPALAMLNQQVKAVEPSAWLATLQHKRTRWDRKMDKKADLARSADVLHPQSVVRSISDTAPDNAVYVVDVGTSTVWAGRHLRFRAQQRMFGSFNHGSLGVGLPGAIGIQSADRDAQVIAICGDGAFAQLMPDFITAVHYKPPIIVVVLNNRKFGFVELEMQAHGYVRYATDIANPDFVQFAESCGGVGLSVKRPDELLPALEQAYKESRPVIIDAHVNPDELFAPAKIEASAAWGYALGKAKELLVASDETLDDD